MKNFVILWLCCFAMQLTAQTTFTSKQWQEDLRFLQHTVHKDYSFLFKKTTAADFDAAVDKLYKEIPSLEPHEINTGLARIIGQFKYGHTRLGIHDNPVPFNQLPVNLYFYKDGIYVQGVHKDYARALGAKVTGIGDMSIENALKAIYPVVPAENDQFFKAYGFLYLTSPQVLHAQGVIPEFQKDVKLALEKDGKSFTMTFTSLPDGKMVPRTYGLVQQTDDWLDVREQGTTPFYLKNLEKIYYFEYLPDHKTLYVRQSQVQDEEDEAIPEFYTRVFDFVEKNDVEKLVIDVRLNGGGNNYKNKAVITRIIESEKINQTGKFFVVIGRRTFSACQNLVNEMDNYTNAIFVGEPTGENVNFYGDNNRVELPNTGIPVYLSFAWWQDKPQWENADWTVPHLAVEMTFDEYRTNQDPVLEACLNFASENFVTDPMQYMTDLYMAGEMEKLQSEAVRMINDPVYKFFDFEGELNRTGYNMIGRGQHQEAVAVFSFVTQLFPNSANAWDSLAEGFLTLGQKEKAIELYNKALTMDPDGPTGKNAQKMLRRISEGED